MSDREYIEKNVILKKDFMERWAASFTCADGYHYSWADASITYRNRRDLVNRLVDLILEGGHPVQ